MTPKEATKIANKIWNRYEKFQQTFSHNLHVYSPKNRNLALEAINNCPRNQSNNWNPTREQFVAEFIKLVTQKEDDCLQQIQNMIDEGSPVFNK